MKTTLLLACLALALLRIHAAEAPPAEKAEVIVYGGTPAGVMAAVAAAKHGHTVALVDINAHIGGVVSGGLVASDMGDTATLGGLSKEFFTRIVKHYTDKYGADSKECKACRNGATFEPHVAELIFEQMIREQPGIKVWRSCRYRSVQPEFDRADGSDRITGLVVDDIRGKDHAHLHR